MTEVEGAPPQDKRSFVSPDDIPKERREVPKETTKPEEKEHKILNPDVALTLIYGKLSDILTEMKTLNSIFSKAATTSQSFSNSSLPSPIAPTTPTPAIKPTEQTPRIKEILTALDPYKDLLNIDIESSTMLVLVKPAQFLGSENFSKIASTIRTIGGQYVSMGKNSHFEVPKAPKRT